MIHNYRFILKSVLVTALLMITVFVGGVSAQDSSVSTSVSQKVTTAAAPAKQPEFPPIPDYYLPKKITLCGETIPLHDRDAYERMEYEFLLVVNGRLQMALWQRRVGRYFPHIEKELAKAGLPDDLKYLAVAESDLRTHVRSHANAVGTWQFIEYTGRRYGLRKDKKFDERLNFEQSTTAAIKYLKRLKNMFGKWTLAMAAYNCGEGCVAKAIKEQEVKDYFRLNLPRETERYVYRIAAIKMLLENPGKYGYSIAPERVYKPVNVDRVRVNLSKQIHFTRAAKAIGTDYKVLKEMNPEIKGAYLPEGTYNLSVPTGKGAKFTAYLKSSGSMAAAGTTSTKNTVKTSKTTKKSSKYYTVRRGDTLARISQKTGVSMSRLRRLNGIKGSHIWVGQKLRLSN